MSSRLKTISGRDRITRLVLIAVSLLFLAIFLFLPLLAVIVNALQAGLDAFTGAISHADTRDAIHLTLTILLMVMPLNIVFGIAAAWTIAKYRFKGKSLLITVIDLPLTVSPVISGTVFILLFGSQGVLGAWFIRHNTPIVFAVPGMVMVTFFVTLPYIVRELVPLMQSLGNQNEEVAISLGASGWQTFWRITLPNIKWGLFYGIVLGAARAIGEFGAVSVVSGHIRGKTITLPLHVEILYNEYNFTAAFGVAALMAGLSLVTILIKKLLEHYKLGKTIWQ